MTTFEWSTEAVSKTTAVLVIDGNARNCVGAISGNEYVVVPIMCERDFVHNLRIKDMGFVQRKIMEVIVSGPVDGALGVKRASAKLIHKQLAIDIYRETQPVLRTEIMVYAPVVSIFGVFLRIGEGKAPHRIRQTVSPVICACTCSHGSPIGSY